METAKKRISVLILEEDGDLADSIRLYLEDSYRVYTVRDPEQLPGYISRYKINILITDIDISYPDIQSKLKKIKSDNPEVKILVMYMFFDEDEKKDNSLLNEVDDYIFKPFNVNVLKHKIDRLQGKVLS